MKKISFFENLSVSKKFILPLVFVVIIVVLLQTFTANLTLKSTMIKDLQSNGKSVARIRRLSPGRSPDGGQGYDQQ